jgi:hypothetical protein
MANIVIIGLGSAGFAAFLAIKGARENIGNGVYVLHDIESAHTISDHAGKAGVRANFEIAKNAGIEHGKLGH